MLTPHRVRPSWRGAARSLVPAMWTAVAAVDPALPTFDAMARDERIDAAIARPRFNATLLGAFAGAALLLAVIGIYGVLAYAVSSRTLGPAIGIAAAAAVERLLQAVLVGDSPWDLRLVATAGLVNIAVAVVAALVPAQRASVVDPLRVLRDS